MRVNQRGDKFIGHRIFGTKPNPSIAKSPNRHRARSRGVRGFWLGCLVFAEGTPAAIVQRLSNAVSETMDTPAVRERIEGFGFAVPPPEQRTPEYLAKFLPAEIEKWAVPIKASGVSID